MIIVLIKKHKGDCRRIRNAASVAPIGPPISFRQKDPSFWQVLSEIRHHLRRILKTLATGQGKLGSILGERKLVSILAQHRAEKGRLEDASGSAGVAGRGVPVRHSKAREPR